MVLNVRPISLDDIRSFWQVLDSVARERRYLVLLEAPPLEEVEKSVRANFESHYGIRFVATDSSEVIGWCDIHPRDEPGFTHIGRLGMGVRTDYRRRGIGRRLLSAALEKAVSDGLSRIELE